VRQAPGDVAARYELGRALLAAGAREEAIQQFRAILRLDPRHEAAARQLNAALGQN
jgi:thioredoxin-like negative regulator of GroEL